MREGLQRLARGGLIQLTVQDSTNLSPALENTLLAYLQLRDLLLFTLPRAEA